VPYKEIGGNCQYCEQALRWTRMSGLGYFHFPVAGGTRQALLQLRCRKYYNYINFAEGS
jgi:hypothetical protein